MNIEREHSKDELGAQRAVGALMLLAGVGFGYFSCYRLLNEASHHAPTLSVDAKAAGITPVLLLFGAAFVLFPRLVLTHLGGFGSRTPKTAMGWVFWTVAIGLGFGFYFWLEAQLRAYGYTT